MKFKILLLTILFGVISKVHAQQDIPGSYNYIVKIGQQAPDFKTTIANGKPFHLADLQGKVIMLQFTASWCSVCRKEMPHIEQEIWQTHKNDPDFVLYAVDWAEPAAKVSAFSEAVPVSYPFLMDPHGTIFHRYAGPKAGITRNVIIGKDGKIVFMTRLYKVDEFNQMKVVINQLLEK